MPFIINLLLFAFLLWLGIHFFLCIPRIGLKIYYRNGCDGLNWLLWILFTISFFIVVVYTFTLVGNIISAPS
ncbi:hypothetical protein [Candidatus Coxiella mudrowiae]|uniref:hypothetical protein n=1 Tax=Candidatus Coxiella mudrowiae TaxID=2054173 RepID=UPI00352CF31C